MKKLLQISAVCLGLGALGVAVWALVVIGPRNLWGMFLYDQRREGDLEVGDPAPGVALAALDGSTRVDLRDHVGGRPLVLVFGSFT